MPPLQPLNKLSIKTFGLAMRHACIDNDMLLNSFLSSNLLTMVYAIIKYLWGRMPGLNGWR